MVGFMQKESSRNLLQQLSKSKIYQDYEQAFSQTTSLPLGLRTAEGMGAVLHGKKHENPFCSLMAQTNCTCAACLETQQKMVDSAREKAGTIVCFAGLCDTAVPIKIGDELVGFLQTGQVALRKPTRAKFNQIASQLIDWGTKADLKRLEEAYFHTRVLDRKQYEAMVRLLEVFAQHLSIVANQILIQSENAESPMIQRAKQFIKEHKGEDISLTDVAKSVNSSTFYFCKMFKKATGLHFTDYLSRIRVEKAKNLLLNPHLRVSEIAFQVGFQSLTHFNRVFRKIVGQSPTAYREALPNSTG
jgi:AraC-like DNA-binding protein